MNEIMFPDRRERDGDEKEERCEDEKEEREKTREEKSFFLRLHKYRSQLQR